MNRRGTVLWIGHVGDDAHAVDSPSARLSALFQLNGWQVYAHPTIFSRTAASILENSSYDMVVVARQYIDSVTSAVKNVNTNAKVIYFPSTLFDPRFTTIYLSSGCQLARSEDDLIQRIGQVLSCPVLHTSLSPRLGHLSEFLSPCLPSFQSSGCVETVLSNRTITSENSSRHFDASKCLNSRTPSGESSGGRPGKDACSCHHTSTNVTTRTQTVNTRLISPEAVLIREGLAAQNGVHVEQIAWNCIPNVEKSVTKEDNLKMRTCPCSGPTFNCVERTEIRPPQPSHYQACHTLSSPSPACVTSTSAATNMTCGHVAFNTMIPSTTCVATCAPLTSTQVVYQSANLPFYENWKRSKERAACSPGPVLIVSKSNQCLPVTTCAPSIAPYASAYPLTRPSSSATCVTTCIPGTCVTTCYPTPCKCICVCTGPGCTLTPTFSLLGQCHDCCKCDVKSPMKQNATLRNKCVCPHSSYEKENFQFRDAIEPNQRRTSPIPCPCLEGLEITNSTSPKSPSATVVSDDSFEDNLSHRLSPSMAPNEGQKALERALQHVVSARKDFADVLQDSSDEADSEPETLPCGDRMISTQRAIDKSFEDIMTKSLNAFRIPANTNSTVTASHVSPSPSSAHIKSLGDWTSQALGVITFSDCPQDPLEILSNSSTKSPFKLDGKQWQSVDHYLLSKMFLKAGQAGLANRIADVGCVEVAHMLAKENLHLLASFFSHHTNTPHTNTRETWTHPSMRLEMIRAVRARIAQAGPLISSLLLTHIRSGTPLQWRPAPNERYDPVALKVNAQLCTILADIRNELERTSRDE